MTYGELLNRGKLLLAEEGIADARIDAEQLLLHISGLTRSFLFVHKNDKCSSEIVGKYSAVLQRRMKGEPVQYITGSQEFMGLEFEVNPAVLIPRQDTEILVEKAIEAAGGPGQMEEERRERLLLDMCCGSGAIAVSMLFHLPRFRAAACDISTEALKTAEGNAVRNGVSDRITFLQGDLFEALKNDSFRKGWSDSPLLFDLILSNPPYIPTGVIPSLQREITEHEPMSALDGGPDGLYFYRILAEKSMLYMKKGGHLFMEIGSDQAEAVSSLLRNFPQYTEPEVIRDLAGLDRVVHCMKR